MWGTSGCSDVSFHVSSDVSLYQKYTGRSEKPELIISDKVEVGLCKKFKQLLIQSKSVAVNSKSVRRGTTLEVITSTLLDVVSICLQDQTVQQR